MKTLPDAGQAAHGFGEVQRTAGQPHRIDRTGRSTDDNRKRIVRRIGQQVSNRRQHAHLIGRPRATTGENQPGNRLTG